MACRSGWSSARISKPNSTCWIVRIKSITSCWNALEKGTTSTTVDPSDLLERLLEIGDQVVRVLDADGNADQRVGHAEPVARLLRHARVRRRRGMRDQRLGAAQAHGELHHLQRVQHPERLGLAAADRERER